jgi:hypothetical protein
VSDVDNDIIALDPRFAHALELPARVSARALAARVGELAGLAQPLGEELARAALEVALAAQDRLLLYGQQTAAVGPQVPPHANGPFVVDSAEASWSVGGIAYARLPEAMRPAIGNQLSTGGALGRAVGREIAPRLAAAGHLRFIGAAPSHDA